jgi:multimeric flavodoxin WrbA
MKVVGICGSPRKGGNTEIALREAMKVFEERGIETETILLCEKDIRYCVHCNTCLTDPCPIQDDIPEILDKMIFSDGIVIASPVYHSDVTAQLKALFDRTLPLRRQGRKLKNKVGGAIAVAQARNGGQEITCSQIHKWMLFQEMIVAVDLNTTHFGGTVQGDRIRLDAAKDDEIGLETCRNLALRMIELMELIGVR